MNIKTAFCRVSVTIEPRHSLLVSYHELFDSIVCFIGGLCKAGKYKFIFGVKIQ